MYHPPSKLPVKGNGPEQKLPCVNCDLGDITIVRYIIKIQMARTQFWECVHFDLELGDMTLGECHDAPLGHGQ